MRLNRALLILLGTITLLSVTPSGAMAQPYVVQPLATPADFANCEAYESNDNGVVIGSCWNATGAVDYRAVVWRDGVPSLLPLPPGYEGSAGIGVNRSGTMTGTCFSSNYGGGCVWENGTVRVLPGVSGNPMDINNAGYITGEVGPGASLNAAVWTPTGSLTILTDFEYSSGRGINDAGIVAVQFGSNQGGHGGIGLWNSVGGTTTPLTAPPGLGIVKVTDVNNLNHVIAVTHDINTNKTQSVVWRNGVPEILPDPADGWDSYAEGINHAGQISGRIANRLLGRRPVIWRGDAPELVSNEAGHALRISTAGVAAGVTNTNGYYVAVLFAPQTAAQAAEEIAEDIQVLIGAGNLTTQDGAALQTHISAAVARIASGNTNAAINVLGAFNNKVEALFNSGRLLRVDADNLKAVSNDLIGRLQN